MHQYRMQDEITWAELPHPDPAVSSDVSISVESQFWRRLISHVEEGRRPWDQWAGWSFVDLLIQASRQPASQDFVPRELPDLVKRTLLGGLHRRTVLAHGSIITRPQTGSGWWRVVAPEGLVFLLSWRDGKSRLVDCYLGAGMDQIDPGLGREGLLEAGSEVLRQLVVRYAKYDEKRGTFTVNDKGMGEPGGLTFVCPEAWGFRKAERGYRWQGISDPTLTRKKPDVPTHPHPRSLPANALGYVAMRSEASNWPPPARSRSSSPLTPAFKSPRDVPGAADPLNLFNRLMRAHATAQDNPEGCLGLKACYDLAVAVGMCEVFGVNAGELSGQLSPGAARNAGLALQEQLLQTAAQVNLLSSRLKEQTPACREETCVNLLESRTRAWAAFRAIDHADPRWDQGVPDTELSAILQSVQTALMTLDDALERTRELWAPWLSGTQLTSNWQKMLWPTVCETAPWWMMEETGKMKDEE